MVHDFLFELGCEELPSSSVWPLADEFQKLMCAALDKAQLDYQAVKAFATPRRFALCIEGLQAEQKRQTLTRRGPASSAAFDAQGEPTPALLGFAKSCGVGVEELSKTTTDKGEWIVYEAQTAGVKTKTLLPELVLHCLSALPIAKPMRWGNSDVLFARPVHWALMIFGDEPIEQEFLGVRSSNQTRGHRFHHPQTFTIARPAEYEVQMKKAFVVADFAQRRALILSQVEALAQEHQATAVLPKALLDEVTSIVEWPQALLVPFEPAFLKVPAQALIASMQSHQKCFALKNKEGALLPYFITVSNIQSKDPQQVVLGNEKVMRARLSDAAFFFAQDQKQPLSHHLPMMEKVIFQAKLGTLADKTRRVQVLMSHWVDALQLEPKQVERAALLSKCDLMTGMVSEFPELQGLMGYYYALHDGEDQEVAVALNEQYMPRFAGDELPASPLGLALSLADRLDTLAGSFSLGLKPSGVKDPFKLRRHALAVVRLLIALPAKLSLNGLIQEAAAAFISPSDVVGAQSTELKSFILDRLQSHYLAQGVPVGIVHAARARQDDWLYDLDQRIRALEHFVLMPQASALAAACKRVANMLNQADASVCSAQFDEGLLVQESEKALYDEIQRVGQDAVGEYGFVLKELARLKEPVDAFFDSVLVMVEDEKLKRNRLVLLAKLQALLTGVADIGCL
jgi:glycyl-tRNA synthetase beta chain